MLDPALKGRVVLVTGANSGIGAATARAFAAQGATLVLHYLGRQRPPEDAAVRVEHEVSGAPAAEALVREIAEAVADAIVFLASEQASWITGQVLQVAGGHAL